MNGLAIGDQVFRPQWLAQRAFDSRNSAQRIALDQVGKAAGALMRLGVSESVLRRLERRLLPVCDMTSFIQVIHCLNEQLVVPLMQSEIVIYWLLYIQYGSHSSILNQLSGIQETRPLGDGSLLIKNLVYLIRMLLTYQTIQHQFLSAANLVANLEEQMASGGDHTFIIIDSEQVENVHVLVQQSSHMQVLSLPDLNDHSYNSFPDVMKRLRALMSSGFGCGKLWLISVKKG